MNLKCLICIETAREDEETVLPVKDAVCVYTGVSVCGDHLERVLQQQQQAIEHAREQHAAAAGKNGGIEVVRSIVTDTD